METEDEPILVLTARQVKEIRLCLHYAKDPHGTVGHNQMLIIAKLAQYLGFTEASRPEFVEVIKKGV